MGRARLTLMLFLAGTLGLAACSSSDDELPYVERPADAIFAEAEGLLAEEEYVAAAAQFDEVERQHPYSELAKKSILMAAYSHYEGGQYDSAILSAQRYLSLYPGDKDASYASYLVAVSYYDQITDVGRDQRMTELALKSLNEVKNRYPESEYARDATLKIDLARDHLAGKEMSVGRYYLKRGQHVAAINRFRNVIENYQTTTHTPEALHRLVEAYLALGVAAEAQNAAAVLGYNYPGSDWYADSYYLLEGVDLRPLVDERSWLTRALDQINPF